MIDFSILLPLFSLGLVSGAHCIGMCGGIMGALTMAIPAEAKSKRWFMLVAYNFGRILSYALMGLLAGLFAEQFAALGGAPILRILAGILLIIMGLYLANWWRGLTKLETLGRYLWVYIQPIGKRLMPVNTIPKALLLGALWGWLPCGLVYAALAMAMTQPAPLLAASAMLAFGLGTLPAVLVAGVAAQRLAQLLQQRALRTVLALIIMVFGVWTMWGGLAHSQGHQHTLTPVSHEENHAAIDHGNMDHSAMDHGNMDHAAMNHSVAQPGQHADSSASGLARQRTENNTTLVHTKTITSSASSLNQAPQIHHH